MGRRLTFERHDALKEATELFWREGYINTSLKQLLKAMEMGESSFYHSFGSKRSLYKECIDYYNGTFMKARIQALKGEASGKNPIYAFFDVVIEDLSGFKQKGCLITNSLASEVLEEQEMRDMLFRDFEGIRSVISKIIIESIQKGEFRSDLDPLATARIIFTYLHGLNRLSVVEFDAEKQRGETQAFLDALLK